MYVNLNNNIIWPSIVSSKVYLRKKNKRRIPYRDCRSLSCFITVVRANTIILYLLFQISKNTNIYYWLISKKKKVPDNKSLYLFGKRFWDVKFLELRKNISIKLDWAVWPFCNTTVRVSVMTIEYKFRVKYIICTIGRKNIAMLPLATLGIRYIFSNILYLYTT